MSVSVDLLSEFAKVTKGDKKTKSESTVYGTTVEYNGKIFVKLDGSELLTPVETTTNMSSGERVTVLIKNHTATVTGNISSPSARTGEVSAIGSRVSELGNKIEEFGSVVAGSVTTEQLDAERARIDSLKAENVTIKGQLTAAEADIDVLEADNVTINERLTATDASIESLKADNVTIHDTLTASNAKIENLKSTKIDTEIAEAKFATIESLEATEAQINNLEATYAEFQVATANRFTAVEGDISKLHSDKLDADTAEITYAKIDDLNASNASITNLEATFSSFEVSTADKLNATDASIERLDTEKLSAKDIEGKFANIDFTNISKATMEYFYANSGLIKDVVIGDQTIAGKLVGVTISGDLIEGNTVVAEKLVIKGDDGLYYKLNTDGVKTETEQTDYNSLNGKIIKAKSITATKIAVDDLVAFGATIGGFHISENAIYSGVKDSATNATRGVYLDKEGQMSFGDSTNYVKYYKNQNGDYKLEISADSMIIGSSNKNIETAINEISEANTTNASDLANYIANTNSELENLQGQIDGSIMTWFYEYVPTNDNIPASEWTTVRDKNNHLGDLFYDTITGYCYRWQVKNNVYSWNRITDVDVTKALADAASAQSTADKKRRVFVTTPTPPYDIGDLWTQGASGDLMKCQTAKTANQSYAAEDWAKATKYTDDTKANAAQVSANTAQSGVDALKLRMASAETQITQNQNQIALMATKTELTETLEGYYTKSQADAAIKVSADSISQNVSSTYATKTALDNTNANVTAAQNTANASQNAINSLKIGGRNLALGTSEEWTDITVGSWSGALYHTVNGTRHFTHSYEDYGVKVGEYLTFSVDLSATDKRIAIRVDHAAGSKSYSNIGNYIEDGETGRSILTVEVKSEYDSFKVYVGSDGTVSENIVQQYKCFKVEKGNRSTDWSSAPEDISSDILEAQETANDAQNGVTALEVRVTEAETAIDQNTHDITLRATKTEVATAKTEAISTASADATTKANTALSSAKTYADAQIKVSSDSIISTVNSVKTTAENANSYVNNAKNNYGYQYKTTITINGDSSTYYPVLILGGDQNVMREIMVKRSYSDTAPEDWNGHPTAKGIALLLKIKCNFGGWGGANYSWVIHELEEMYGNTFAGASNVMANMGFVIFLRGGGETGALYHIFSDQQLDRDYMNGYSVRICYEQERIGWSGGTEDNPTFTWNAPAPRTLTDSVKEEIASKKYIDVATSAQNGVNDLTTRMTSAETKIQQNTDSIELRATKTELSTVSTAAANAQSTADTANSTANTNKTNLANNYYTKTQTDAKIKVESDKISSAVTRITAAETAISTLEQTADGFEVRLNTTDSNVATAQSTANTANTNATNAAKTATNFLSYDSTNGLLLGNKSSGSWSGTRAQIKSDSFNVLDQNGKTLASYGTTTTIGKTSGNNVYIDSDSIDIRRNGKVLATFDQYGLKIANTNDSSGSLGSGSTKPALVIGTPTGYHIEMDNNEIMAKSNATTSSHLFLNMEGGNVSFNNNANRAMMFQEGALYAKNSSYYNGEYLGILDALNDAGNTTLGYGGYNNSIGSTNIYGNSISLVSNGDINVEASWIRCRSIAPNDHATYALGVYGEKGWSNIYLGKGDNKTNALHIINGSSTYLLCGVNSSGQYVFGNNAAVMYYQVKDVGTDNTGNAFKITSGNNTASNNTNSVWLFGAADSTSRYIGSYMAYSRTYSSAANMIVTANGVFGRSTSSSERYKNSIIEADISELKPLYDLPVKKFKYNDNYIASDDELYGKYLYGFIVEDLDNVLPCAVQHITDDDGNVLPEMWNSNIIVPALLKLIQDLNSRVKTLEEKEV